MQIKFRHTQEGGHHRVRVFVGIPGQTYALAGHFMLREEELEEFYDALDENRWDSGKSNREVITREEVELDKYVRTIE